MSTFDERKSSAETKYVLDAAKEFKAQARRNKQLGLWAAEQMGLKADEREAFAQKVIVADMEEAGDDDVFRFVQGQFRERGVGVTDEALRAKMDEMLYEVRKALAEED